MYCNKNIEPDFCNLPFRKERRYVCRLPLENGVGKEENRLVSYNNLSSKASLTATITHVLFNHIKNEGFVITIRYYYKKYLKTV